MLSTTQRIAIIYATLEPDGSYRLRNHNDAKTNRALEAAGLVNHADMTLTEAGIALRAELLR